jgi:hypothetical protein
MMTAAEDEKTLRARGQAKAADQILRVAEDRAKLILESARRQADVSLESAQRRSAPLIEQSRHDIPRYRPTLEGARDIIISLLGTTLRSFGLLALGAFALTVWGQAHPSAGVVLAVGMASVAVAIGGTVGGLPVGEFFVPLFVASVVVASQRRELAFAQLISRAVYFIYERFSVALLLVALQFAVALCAALGVGGVVYIASNWYSSPQFIPAKENTPQMIILGSPDLSIVAGLVGLAGAMIGFEFARTVAVLSFISVLLGGSDKSLADASASPEQSQCDA